MEISECGIAGDELCIWAVTLDISAVWTSVTSLVGILSLEQGLFCCMDFCGELLPLSPVSVGIFCDGMMMWYSLCGGLELLGTYFFCVPSVLLSVVNGTDAGNIWCCEFHLSLHAICTHRRAYLASVAGFSFFCSLPHLCGVILRSVS